MQRKDKPFYKYKSKIISYKIKNNLTQKDMAKLLNIDFEDYLEYEQGYSHIEEDYINLIEKLIYQ